jgi:dTDP-4-dehydrorhamnose reductase
MYVDLEAVRMSHLKHQVGPAKRLREVWERYGIPIAYHRGPPRLQPRRAGALAGRGLDRVREGAAQGRDIRAVTLWSMFGASTGARC